MTAITQEQWRWAVVRAAMLILLTSLPYMIVSATTPQELFYTGFLTNPEDGHSYLAKMRQGERGDWLFRLPYSAEPHHGEFVFTYYVALGHLARWTSLPLIAVWHIARIVNGFVLLMVVYYAVAHWFQDIAQRKFAFMIIALGSGLGWLIVLLGGMTVDLWVPEGYVFYSLLANPHFPLAIALMLLTLVWSATPWGARRPTARRLVGTGLGAAALGVVQPLGLLTLGAVLLTYTTLLWVQRRRPPWREIATGAALAVGGGPFVLNAYLASTRNPLFGLWSAQNQTPSPPPWDYAWAYGIVLLLALPGLWTALRRRRDSDWLLVTWTASTAVLLYLPFSLQRRLVMGLIVPLGMLATLGWAALQGGRAWLRPAVVWSLAGLTSLFLVLILLTGALSGSSVLFMGQDERAALAWLAEHAPPDALVIAAPDTGLYIPAWAGQRVWYGHRFETAQAELRRAQLESFYVDDERTLLEKPPPLRAEYVWAGPREQSLSGGHWEPDPAWRTVFGQGAVTLYALSPD